MASIDRFRLSILCLWFVVLKEAPNKPTCLGRGPAGDDRLIEVVTNAVTKNIFLSQKRKRPAQWLA